MRSLFDLIAAKNDLLAAGRELNSFKSENPTAIEVEAKKATLKAIILTDKLIDEFCAEIDSLFDIPKSIPIYPRIKKSKRTRKK